MIWMDDIPFLSLRKLVSGTRIIKSLKPSSQRRLCGTALTVRVTDESFKAQLNALDNARPGDVIVAVAESMNAPAWSSFLSRLAEKKSIAGIVIDGIAEKDVSLPIYARDFVEFDPFMEHSIDTKQRGSTFDFSPVEIDNCRIERGDFIVGEGNEIIAVSRWSVNDLVQRYNRIKKVKKEPSKMKALDKKDVELLAHLFSNSRSKLEDLSKSLELSPGAVTYRMKKLEDKGVIRSYTAEFDLGSLGFVEPFFMVVWCPPEEIEGVAERISAIKRVTEVYMVGMDELLVKTRPKDRAELLSIIEMVNRMDNVTRAVVVSSIKVFKERPGLSDLLG